MKFFFFGFLLLIVINCFGQDSIKINEKNLPKRNDSIPFYLYLDAARYRIVLKRIAELMPKLNITEKRADEQKVKIVARNFKFFDPYTSRDSKVEDVVLIGDDDEYIFVTLFDTCKTIPELFALLDENFKIFDNENEIVDYYAILDTTISFVHTRYPPRHNPTKEQFAKEFNFTGFMLNTFELPDTFIAIERWGYKRNGQLVKEMVLISNIVASFCDEYEALNTNKEICWRLPCSFVWKQYVR